MDIGARCSAAPVPLRPSWSALLFFAVFFYSLFAEATAAMRVVGTGADPSYDVCRAAVVAASGPAAGELLVVPIVAERKGGYHCVYQCDGQGSGGCEEGGGKGLHYRCPLTG